MIVKRSVFLLFSFVLAFAPNKFSLAAEFSPSEIQELKVIKGESDGKLSYYAVVNSESYEVTFDEYEHYQAIRKKDSLAALIAREKAREDAYWDSVTKNKE